MSEGLSNILSDQYTRLELELLELLEFYEHQPKKRLVHQMRINLKKQLAFLNLIKELLPAELLDSHQQIIREFQKRLGKVRNYQVQFSKAEAIEAELALEKEVSDRLKKQEKAYLERWLKFKAEAHLAEAMAKIRNWTTEVLPELEPAILEEQILGQMRHTLFEIKCLSNVASFDSAKFHDLRSFLKRLLFYWHFLQAYFADLPIDTGFWDVVKRLEQALGAWHDYQSLLKKVDAKEHEAFAFVVKDYLEDYSVKVRALLPLLDELVAAIEPLFLS